MVIEEGNTNLQKDRPPLGRTFAITVVSVGWWAESAAMALLTVWYAAELNEAMLISVFALITVIFAVMGAVSAFWSGARRRSWFWLAAAILAFLWLVPNLQVIPYDITHPANTRSFLVAIVALTGGLAVIVGGIPAFLEVRRGRPVWTRIGRAGWMSVGVIGVVVGAVMTSLAAGLASSGGAGVAEAPTITGVLTVEKTAFVEASLQIDNGEILGLFVINKDAGAHSFDIDSLDIHVELPANSTTTVAIKPTGPGNLDFFCSVPGHREAGMVGTITVAA
ncbi:MAG TPA: cupredoxin domain-containing protein [Acidimicrobiia bacterium]|jgi:nitrite reductase (NO-forming)|nr:cupredoxin domain-containing protein [Acidimicrobiia bacterium]